MHDTNDSFEPTITYVNEIQVEYEGNREKEDVNSTYLDASRGDLDKILLLFNSL